MAALIEQLGGWAWWILGLVLLGFEVVLPGTFFLWFGVSAIVIGASALLFDWAWQIQAIGFVVLALILVLVGRRYFRGWSGRPDEDSLINERTGRLIGVTYVLGEPIVNGHGRLRIDDTTWRVAGPDLPSGSRVRIVAADGALLRVQAAE